MFFFSETNFFFTFSNHIFYFVEKFCYRSSAGGKHKKKDPNTTMKRFTVVIVIGIIAFLTILMILSRLGRKATEDDPFLDPMANPNIRVGGQ